jgi:cell wall-associated NlpC family hydrolase
MSHHLRSCLLVLALVVGVAAARPGPAGANEATGVGPVRAQPQQAAIVRREPVGRVELPARGELAARAALEQVGIAYRWGGESPATGFDCSGLVRWAYRQVGLDLPHSSYALYNAGRAVSASRLAPGDVLFFDGLGHVGLYVGGGRMVHAPQTGRNVEIVQLDRSGYGLRLVGARRVAPA